MNRKWPKVIALIIVAVLVVMVAGRILATRFRTYAAPQSPTQQVAQQPASRQKTRVRSRTQAQATRTSDPGTVAATQTAGIRSAPAGTTTAPESCKTQDRTNDMSRNTPAPAAPALIRVTTDASAAVSVAVTGSQVAVSVEHIPDPGYRFFRSYTQNGRQSPESGWQHFRWVPRPGQ